MNTKPKEAIAELQTEADKIKTRIEKDRKRLTTIQERIKVLTLTAELTEVVGIPNAAFISYGASTVRLRGKRATIVKLNRTRASVEVDGETWFFPFELLHVDPVRAELEATLNRRETA